MTKKHPLGMCIEGQTVLVRLILSAHWNFRLKGHSRRAESVFCLQRSFWAYRATAKPSVPAKGLEGAGMLHSFVGVQQGGEGIGLGSGSTLSSSLKNSLSSTP